MSHGRAIFVGCGPGAADLLTLRGADAIARADIVIWGSSLIPREVVTDHARPDAEIVEWPPATMTEVLQAYDRARDGSLTVVRLKSGDPAVFGALEEELAAARERRLEIEIVPGVSALGAAAALAGAGITRDDVAGRVALVSATDAAAARLRPATVAVFMAGANPEESQRAVIEQGVAPDDPCVIVHRATWPGEIVIRCRAGDLGEQLSDLGLDGLTIVLAGPALAGPETG